VKAKVTIDAFSERDFPAPERAFEGGERERENTHKENGY